MAAQWVSLMGCWKAARMASQRAMMKALLMEASLVACWVGYLGKMLMKYLDYWWVDSLVHVLVEPKGNWMGKWKDY